MPDTSNIGTDELEYSIRFDRNIELEETTASIISSLVDEIIRHYSLRRNMRTIRQLTRTVGTLAANLKRAYDQDPALFVGVSLGPQYYNVASRYNANDLGYDNVRRAIEFFRDRSPALLAYHESYRLGHLLRTTRIRSTEAFRQLFSGLGFGPASSPLSIVQSSRFETIILRNENKKLIEYVDPPEIVGMRSRLAEYNDYFAKHFVDIFLSDQQLRSLYEDDDPSSDAAPDDIQGPVRRLDLSGRTLYRVFNNSSFEQGGRFYGGWWQGVPSKKRQYITINDNPTRELDYSKMQPAMLYTMEGVSLVGDAYAIEGVPTDFRPLLKKTFFQLINAETRKVRQPDPTDFPLPEGWTWRRIQDGVREKHAPIARHFNSGIGIKLQRMDSDIAEKVMMRMKALGRLVLPIHDSFIVDRWRYTQLKEEMLKAYREVMGAEIEVDVEHSFADFLLGGEPIEPGSEGDEFVVDEWDGRAREPGYDGYYHRMDDFLRRQTPEYVAVFRGQADG